MFRSALRELRFHPGRFAATLVAVAIAVGFMAAASVVTATEDHAMGRQQTMRYGAADLVVGVTGGPRSVGAHEVTAALAAVPGVAAVEPSDTTLEPVESASGTGLVNITALPGEPFRSTALAAGRWPTAPGEVVLGRAAAQDLEVGVGDSLRTVHSKATLTVVGLVDLPKSRLGALAFTSDVAQFGHERFGPYGRWIVKAAPGGDLDALADALRDAVAGLQVEAEALSLDSVAQEASGNIDSFKYLLWVFAAIAMTVGAITIANTFTITLAQRRRQIGLLRAVGALGSQVRRSILAEAVLLGLTGSVLGLGLAVGLAAIVGAFTGSLHWGLVLLPADLGLAAGLGTLITVAAAVAPVLRSTRVKPLEALQPVAAATGPGRRSAVRIAFCAVTLAAGLGLALVSLQADGDALVIAIGAALLVTASVLVGAPLFVPALVRCLGAAAGLLGPTVRLAKANALRNPRRIAATATALMLAVGLVFTIQVGSASMRETMLAKIDSSRPIDLTVYPPGGDRALPDALVDRLAQVPGVGAAVAVSAVDARLGDPATGSSQPVRVFGYDPALAGVVRSGEAGPADDVVFVDSDYFQDSGTRTTLTGPSGAVDVTIQKSKLAEGSFSWVSPATLAKLGAPTPNAMVVLGLPDRSAALETSQDIEKIISPDGLETTGAVFEAAQLEEIVNILMLALTALLAIAVLIALVGVANTLTLSVIERTHENALLRAIGVQKSQLRTMLMAEALLVTGAGALAGLVAGLGFGWLGTRAIVRQAWVDGQVQFDPRFAVDWPLTGGLLATLTVAAVLASLLPARRAAKATVVEALADV